MKNLTCFHCEKDITDINDHIMYAIDNPYVNLFFHKNCWNMIGGYENILLYVTANIQKIYLTIKRNNAKK